MKRLLDWLLAIAGMAAFLATVAHVQAGDEWADARRDAEVRAEIMGLLRGME